jgi:leucyl/phenylalanyl-tRNA---protein transferase
MQVPSSQTKIINPKFLYSAYCNGYFPMADPNTGEISWHSPDPRTILDLNDFHIPHSLTLTLKKKDIEVHINKRFEEVMRACAQREETWISEVIIQSYLQLYHDGFAHSIETWRQGTLIGGLYGVAIQGAFFGESMFSTLKDGSKIALVHLVQRMKERGYTLLDTQYLTPHLQRFGAREIPRSEYMKRLEESLTIHCSFIDEEL